MGDVALQQLEGQTLRGDTKRELRIGLPGPAPFQAKFYRTCYLIIFKKGKGWERRKRNVFIGVCNMEFISDFDETSFYEVMLGKEARLEGVL